MQIYPALVSRADEQQQGMIVISGTIPAEYRRQTFNIPVELWIPFDFPATCPRGIVVPATGMMLKATKHVNPTNGVFNFPVWTFDVR